VAEADPNDRILQAKENYLLAVRNFNEARDAKADRKAQCKLLNILNQQGIAYFNCIERSIIDCEKLDVAWRRTLAVDLALTAANALENAILFHEKLSREAVPLEVEPPLPSKNAYAAMQSSVLTYCPDQATTLRKNFEKANLPIRGFTHPHFMNNRYANWEKIAMGITAVIFLGILLAIGVWQKSFEPERFFIFRTVLALIGAAFAAIFIPGLLQVQTKVLKIAVRAGGAAAFFAIIYLINPPGLISSQSAVKTNTNSISHLP
jgi:hypothetical protein